MKLNEINQLVKSLGREVWVVTSAHEGHCNGLIATFVSPISIVPEVPRFAVALSKLHHTWSLVQKSGVLAVHLLTADQVELAWKFGTQTGREVDKFADVPFHVGTTGSPILSEAKGWLECRVEASFDTGDRTLFLVEVVDGDFTATFAPLTQRQLIELATPAQLQILRSQLDADATQDAIAIRKWRAKAKP
jgi:flavin reductase (DIM6/NTAB) family NADH-FMN oxidoreductase RutF